MRHPARTLAAIFLGTQLVLWIAFAVGVAMVLG